jgi:hypothetical protein
MKARLNLTIDEALLSSIKTYASNNQTSVSELVENYFKQIARPAKRKNIVDLVEKLERPHIDGGADLKELYYEDKGAKYGF